MYTPGSKRPHQALMSHPNNPLNFSGSGGPPQRGHPVVRPVARRVLAPAQQSGHTAPVRAPQRSIFQNNKPTATWTRQQLSTNTPHRRQQDQLSPGTRHQPRLQQLPQPQQPANRWTQNQNSSMSTPNRWTQGREPPNTTPNRWQHHQAAQPKPVAPSSTFTRHTGSSNYSGDPIADIDLDFQLSTPPERMPPQSNRRVYTSGAHSQLYQPEYADVIRSPMQSGHGGAYPSLMHPTPAQQAYGNPATPQYHSNPNMMHMYHHQQQQGEYTNLLDHYDYQPEPRYPSYRVMQYEPREPEHHHHSLQANPTQRDAQSEQNTNAAETVKEEVKVKRDEGPDRTLKVITATIEGMKHWVQYRTTAPMLFQLIVTVDSAVTVDPELSSYHFLLRDERDSIEAVFYGIDRPMPKVVRGQTYRCVGKVTTNGDKLQCLSIRLATDSEKRLHKPMVTMVDKHLRSWVRQINRFNRRR